MNWYIGFRQIKALHLTCNRRPPSLPPLIPLVYICFSLCILRLHSTLSVPVLVMSQINLFGDRFSLCIANVKMSWELFVFSAFLLSILLLLLLLVCSAIFYVSDCLPYRFWLGRCLIRMYVFMRPLLYTFLYSSKWIIEMRIWLRTKWICIRDEKVFQMEKSRKDKMNINTSK